MLGHRLIQLSSSCLNNHFYVQVFLGQNFTPNVTEVIFYLRNYNLQKHDRPTVEASRRWRGIQSSSPN